MSFCCVVTFICIPLISWWLRLGLGPVQYSLLSFSSSTSLSYRFCFFYVDLRSRYLQALLLLTVSLMVCAMVAITMIMPTATSPDVIIAAIAIAWQSQLQLSQNSSNFCFTLCSLLGCSSSSVVPSWFSSPSSSLSLSSWVLFCCCSVISFLSFRISMLSLLFRTSVIIPWLLALSAVFYHLNFLFTFCSYCKSIQVLHLSGDCIPFVFDIHKVREWFAVF